MAKNKMPSSSSKTKKKRNNQRKPHVSSSSTQPPLSSSSVSHHDPSSINKLIDDADVAMEASNCTQALDLYGTAAEGLRYLIGGREGEHGIHTEEDQDKDVERYTLLLAKLLGRSGEARVTLDDVESGRADFLEAISLFGMNHETTVEEEEEENPGKVKQDDDSSNHSNDVRIAERCEILADLHLYLAQLSDGDDALAAYKKGIVELESCVGALSRQCNASKIVDDVTIPEESDLEKALNETRKKLCSAYCSVAELYLTDLCFEPDAETQCETALNQALKNDDGTTPDALQAKANLRLSQSRGGVDASDAMLQAWERMRIGCEELASLVGLGPEDVPDKAIELVNIDAAAALPSFEFRCQSAKILLECAATLSGETTTTTQVMESNRCCEAAIQVLGSLMAEDDEVIETWYLLGCAFMASSPANPEMAIHHWERALEMLVKVQEGLERDMKFDEANDDNECFIKEQLEEVQNQIKDVREKINEVKTTAMDES